MATPSSMRATMSVATLGEAGASSEPTTKMPPPQRRVARLPMMSAMAPPASAPDIAPTSTTLTTTASIRIESEKDSRTKISAAAITPMSKP